MTVDAIRARVRSVCASQPFGFTQAQTPFSFELQPSGAIDEVFRVETDGGSVIGGFNYLEERTDLLSIWVARKYAGDPDAAYQRLLTDASSIRAAVIRDAHAVSGEYGVPAEGAGLSVQRPGGEFAVLRLTLPVNYETFV